jgi:uncharacterized protein YydD (DUF2326 family)
VDFTVLSNAGTLIVGLAVGLTSAKISKKHLNIAELMADNDTEKVAYERVEFVLEEIERLKKEVKSLRARLDDRDEQLLEAERIKVLSLNRVTLLQEENTHLKDEISKLKGN